MTTFSKTNTKQKRPSTKRRFDVLVVIRHTRAGDQRVAVMDNHNETSVRLAMERAELIAEDAAQHYGYGSSSVFKATLTLKGKALQPKVRE